MHCIGRREFDKPLWSMRTGNGATLWHSGIGGVGNSPITYELDGRQYVVVGGGARYMHWRSWRRRLLII